MSTWVPLFPVLHCVPDFTSHRHSSTAKESKESIHARGLQGQDKLAASVLIPDLSQRHAPRRVNLTDQPPTANPGYSN